MTVFIMYLQYLLMLMLILILYSLPSLYTNYIELGICESYGTDPRFPPPPKSERSYQHYVTRNQCFKDAMLVDKNRALLPGGVRIFHPY